MNQAARKLEREERAERYRREEQERRESRSAERASRRQARLTRRVYACFVGVTLALFALLFSVARLNISSAQKALRVREVREAVEEERKKQETLQTEVARLESAARIEKMAERELGMVRATGSLVIRRNPEREGAANEPAPSPGG